MNSEYVERLDYYKEKLVDSLHSYYDNKIDKKFKITDEEFRECRRVLLKISEETGKELTSSIKKARRVKECFDFFMMESDEYTQFGSTMEVSIEDLIVETFNDYINYLEDNMYDIQLIKVQMDIPESFSMNEVKSLVTKCEQRLEDEDYAGVITLCRTILEKTLKELLQLLGEDLNGKEDFPTLFKTLRKQLNMEVEDKKADEALKSIISGLNSAAKGLNEIRNRFGDGHHTKGKPYYHHALLMLNCTKTLVSFLFQTYEYQRSKKVV